MNLAYSQQIFGKHLNIKFHENPSSESRVFPCGNADRETEGQTDRHDDANSRLRNFTNAPKIQPQSFCNYVNTTNGLQKYHIVTQF